MLFMTQSVHKSTGDLKTNDGLHQECLEESSAMDLQALKAASAASRSTAIHPML
jgi:hypothetical protein